VASPVVSPILCRPQTRHYSACMNRPVSFFLYLLEGSHSRQFLHHVSSDHFYSSQMGVQKMSCCCCIINLFSFVLSRCKCMHVWLSDNARFPSATTRVEVGAHVSVLIHKHPSISLSASQLKFQALSPPRFNANAGAGWGELSIVTYRYSYPYR
jgi:hypothetical protein